MQINASTQPIPDDLPDGRRREVKRTRERLQDRTHWRTADGRTDFSDETMVVRWTESGKAVPPHVFEDAFMNVPSGQEDEFRREQDEALDAHRTAQEERTPEEIEAQRRRARSTHGPGVELVNVVTGERFTT